MKCFWMVLFGLVWCPLLLAADVSPSQVSQLSNAGRDAAAIRTAKQLLERNPHDADTAHRLAKLLFEVKRYAEAGDILARAVPSAKLEQSLAMRLLLARCRTEAQDHAAAEKVLNETRLFLQKNRNPFTEHELATTTEAHGRALLRLKKFADATVAFQEAHDSYADPKRANDTAGANRLHENLAELHTLNGEPQKAIFHWEKYLESQPKAWLPYQRYAELLRKSDPKKSLAQLRKLNERGTLHARWLFHLEELRLPATFTTGQSELLELIKKLPDEAAVVALLDTYLEHNGTTGLVEMMDSIYPSGTDEPRKTKSLSPAESDRRLLFARAFLAQPQAARRVAMVLRVSGQNSHSPEFWELLAEGCSRWGKPEDVEAALRAAYGRGGQRSDNFRLFQRLQGHLYTQRKWQEILTLCDESQFFGQGVLNYYRATAYAELGVEVSALRAIERAEADNAFASRRQKIHLLDILGRHDAMLKECDTVMAEFRTPSETYSLRYLRSRALQGLHRHREAEDELRGLLDDQPDDALALNNLGYNLADQNRKLDEAETLIRRAIEIDGDARRKAGEAIDEHAAYIDSLGWVLFRKGKLNEAREQFERAVQLADGATDPTVWDHLGDVAFRMNDVKRAKEAWSVANKFYATTHMGRQEDRHAEVRRKLRLTE